jgi:predicted PurR-regulated permease PerM
VGGFFRGQLILATAVGVLTWLGFLLLGIPLALPLGFLTGVGNLIPFFGPLLAGVPAILLAVTKGGWSVLGALAVLIDVQQLDTYLLSPLVFARTTPLHPVSVILAVFIGFSLFGVWGRLLAVPAAALVKLIYTRYYCLCTWYCRTETPPDASGNRVEGKVQRSELLPADAPVARPSLPKPLTFESTSTLRVGLHEPPTQCPTNPG